MLTFEHKVQMFHQNYDGESGDHLVVGNIAKTGQYNASLGVCVCVCASTYPSHISEVS